MRCLLFLVAANQAHVDVAHRALPTVNLAFQPSDGFVVVEGFLQGTGLVDAACISALKTQTKPKLEAIGESLMAISAIRGIDLHSLDTLDTALTQTVDALEELPATLQVCEAGLRTNMAAQETLHHWMMAFYDPAGRPGLGMLAGLAAIPNFPDKVADLKAKYAAGSSQAQAFGHDLGVIFATIGPVATHQWSDADRIQMLEGLAKGLGVVEQSMSGEACVNAANMASMEIGMTLGALNQVEVDLEVAMYQVMDGQMQEVASDMSEKFTQFSAAVQALGQRLHKLPAVLGTCGMPAAEAKLSRFLHHLTDPAEVLKVVGSLVALPDLAQHLEEARAAFAQLDHEKLGEKLGKVVQEIGVIASARLDWQRVTQGVLVGAGLTNLQTCVVEQQASQHVDEMMMATELLQQGFREKKEGVRKLLKLIPEMLLVYLRCETAGQKDLDRLSAMVTRLSSPSSWGDVMQQMSILEVLLATDDARTAFENEDSEGFGTAVGRVAGKLADEPAAPSDGTGGDSEEQGDDSGKPTGDDTGKPTGGDAGKPTGGDAGKPTGGDTGKPTGGDAGSSDPLPLPADGSDTDKPVSPGSNGLFFAILAMVSLAVVGIAFFTVKYMKKSGGLSASPDARAMELSAHHNQV